MSMFRSILTLALLILTARPALAKLEIDKVEACYSLFGPVRRTTDFYPNEKVYYRFVVRGVKTDGEGKADVDLTTKLFDPDRKEVLSQRIPSKGAISFGSESFPAYVFVFAPETAAPGEYTLKVTERDNLAGEETGFERKLSLKPTQFAVVSPEFFHDSDHKVQAPVGSALGQPLFFRMSCIGFDRSQGKIDTEMVAQAFDKDNKPVLSKPITVVVASADEQAVREAKTADFRAGFHLMKPGEFTLRITVTDRIGKKTAIFEAPLKVTAP
jgi:hypothetical protein